MLVTIGRIDVLFFMFLKSILRLVLLLVMEEELYKALTDNDYEFTAKHKKQLFEGNHRQTNQKENDP